MENFNESSHVRTERVAQSNGSRALTPLLLLSRLQTQYESTSSNLTSNCYGTDQSSMASEHIESDASSVIASEKPHQDAVTASEGHLDA